MTTNKWTLSNGRAVSTNDGLTAHDLINKGVKDSIDSIIDPVVDRLEKQDKAKTDAEFANLGKRIDRERINRANQYLNEKLEEIATHAIEAGKRVEEQKLSIEGETIDAEIVEVKSFKSIFEFKLSGALTATPESKQLEGTNDFDGLM